MSQLRHLIIGMGQIGQAVKEAVCDNFDVQTIDRTDKAIELPIDVMHICFPYSEDFVAQVDNYAKIYSPRHVVVYSTVPIGTTKQIMKAVHSPIEGKHPDLDDSIRLMERFIGYNDKEEGEFFYRLFKKQYIKCKLVPSSDHTEALKLLSTTEYGINIEFARYKKQVADSLGMDYKLTKDWNEAYNDLYQELRLDDKYQKYVLDPPDGPKGGHCVTPNALLLHEQYPSELTKIVGEL